MVLAIIAFALEAIFITSVNGMTISGQVPSDGFAWFVVVVFAFCTLSSLCTLVNAAKNLRVSESKGKRVVQLVFSIVGLVFGLIFLIAFFSSYLGAIS